MAGSTELVGHPGIEQQGIHHRGIVQGAGEILRAADPQGFPEQKLGIQPLAQLHTTLRCFLTVQLNHPMALAGRQPGHFAVGRIGHHKHPEAGGSNRRHGRKQRLSLRRSEETGGRLHRDHSDRIHPEFRHGRCLGRLTESADLQEGHGIQPRERPLLSRIPQPPFRQG